MKFGELRGAIMSISLKAGAFILQFAHKSYSHNENFCLSIEHKSASLSLCSLDSNEHVGSQLRLRSETVFELSQYSIDS